MNREKHNDFVTPEHKSYIYDLIADLDLFSKIILLWLESQMWLNAVLAHNVIHTFILVWQKAWWTEHVTERWLQWSCKLSFLFLPNKKLFDLFIYLFLVASFRFSVWYCASKKNRENDSHSTILLKMAPHCDTE